MKLYKFLLITLVVSFSFINNQAFSETIKKENLKILFVGSKDQKRFTSFEKLLNDYFTTVKSIQADDYTPEMSDNYDVTVMDATPKRLYPGYSDREKGIMLAAGVLPYDFDRPVLAIGQVNDAIGRRIGTKNDWYCLCLDADAHHWQTNHPIFNGPFKVKMTQFEAPTPEGALHYPYFHDGPLPKKVTMWKVQTRGYSTDRNMPIGMVARPWKYVEGQESENISSGVCAKTLDAVALGRHGNFFHWGFAACPDDMTDEAKPVLANAIVYISKFAGKAPIVRKFNDRIATREYIKELKYQLTRECYEARMQMEKEFAAYMLKQKSEAEAKQAKGETLSKEEQRSLSYTSSDSPQKSYEEFFEENAKRGGLNLFEKFGFDIDAYNKYFDENYDYFYGEGFYHLEIDEDVKGLRIPNYDIRLLDTAIKMLEDGKDAAKAKRVLARYTLADFATPGEWRNWYEKYKNLLFWTEPGGWQFVIDSYEPGINDYIAKQKRRFAADIKTGETDDAKPVALAAEEMILQNGTRILLIKAKVHTGYHIYDAVSQSDAYNPTAIDIVLPEGYKTKGGLKRPFGGYYNQAGTTVYKDTVIFSQEIEGSGAGEIKVTVDYQCCDSQICFPPERVELKVKLK